MIEHTETLTATEIRGAKARGAVVVRLDTEQGGPWETVTHDLVDTRQRLSITSSTYYAGGGYSGGATLEGVLELAPTDKRLLRLEEIRERWHLNDLRAGCAHQEATWECTNPIHEEPVLNGWSVIREKYGEHPYPQLGDKCHVCGRNRWDEPTDECHAGPKFYRYGTRWLYEPLPEGLWEEIKGLMADLKTSPPHPPAGGGVQTVEEWAREHEITMSCMRAGANPHMARDTAEQMDHWRCTLKRPGQHMQVYYSMGYGHGGKPPELVRVLETLASDAAGIENARNFNEWAAEYGYDTDSRAAEKTYGVVREQAGQLRAFLDDNPLYHELLYTLARD